MTNSEQQGNRGRVMAKRDDKTVLDYALDYHRIGWCVIPVPYGKKAAQIRWRKYQKNRPDKAQLKKWFASNNRNIAVIVGEVSNGLACRDFDTMTEYELWAEKHPEFAKTLSTVRTARGRHVYFRQKQVEGIKTLSEGELRCSRCYCLLPPSLHPEGSSYQWLIPPNGELLELSLKDFDITNFTEEREEPEEPEDIEDIEELEAISKGVIVFDKLDVELQNYVNTAIERTLPDKRGYRNFLIFQFCRWLKGRSEFEKCKAGQLKPLVRLWHEKALATIGTKSFDDTWADFCYGWPRVKFPKRRDNTLKIATQNALNAKNTLAAEELYEKPEVKLLVRICYELQALQKTEPFWLSENDGALILGVTRPTMGKWLCMLEADGIIKKTKEHTATKATRYKFIAKYEK